MARIFISFFNAAYDITNLNIVPIFYESFINGLKKAGNELLIYPHKKFGEIEWGNIPEPFAEQIRSFNPDVCFLFNNAFYDISNIVSCPIVIYEVDSPRYYGNQKKLKKNAGRYQYFCAQEASLDILKTYYNVPEKNMTVLPFFTEVQAEELPIKENICFIGSLFSDMASSPLNKLMKQNITDFEKKELKQIISILKQNPFVSLKDIFHSSTIKKECDCSAFIHLLSSVDRVQILSEIADLGLQLYGTSSWATNIVFDPDLLLSYCPDKIYSLKQNQDIYNSSKIGINIKHLQAVSGFPWRTMDIMASNACLVSQYCPDFEKYFPGISIPTFSNKFEAREQCKKLLANEEMRLDIVRQCQEIINQKYRFKHCLARMEYFLGISIHTGEMRAFHDVDISLPMPSGVTKLILSGNNISRCDEKSSKRPFRYSRTGIKIALGLYSLLFLISLVPPFNLFIKRKKIFKKIQRKYDQLYK